MVFGTSHSKENSNYGGGHLLRDLVEGKEVLVETETDKGKFFARALNIPYARIFSTRTPSRTTLPS
jgi:uncharacterized protein (DUF39 family)